MNLDDVSFPPTPAGVVQAFANGWATREQLEAYRGWNVRVYMHHGQREGFEITEQIITRQWRQSIHYDGRD